MISTDQFTRIPVQAPGATYDIIVGDGVLQAVPALLAERKLNGKVAVVTNETIAPLYGKALVQQLGNAVLITLPDGEAYKTLESVSKLYDAFIDAALDRQSVVIGLGGGVIGDMAGYAAATFLRGVPYVQVPTSLLAMVDSSVGGKVGVDLLQGKNLIGAFKQPEMVLVDPTVLSTLPEVEWRCGVAEVIKAGFLADDSLLDAKLYQQGYTSAAVEFIVKAIQFKVDIVQKDPYEANIRAYLNLGHTFGHALERVSNFAWRHGEAVGWGLVAAARLSEVHGFAESGLSGQVEALVKAVGLPTRYSGYDPEEIRAVMGTDKKRTGSTIRFVLLRKIGDPLVSADVTDAEIMTVLASLREA